MVFNDVGAIFRDLVPVDDVPPVGNVFRPTVLVFEVITAVNDKE